MDFTPLLTLKFSKRLILLVVGVFLYLLPETLTALTGAVFPHHKSLGVEWVGGTLAVTAFASILFVHGIEEDAAENRRNRHNKAKKSNELDKV